MTNKSTSTAVQQSMIIAAKGEFVVAQPVNYGLSHTQQPEAIVVEPIVGNDVEGATRVNALQAVIYAIDAIDFEYDNFYSIFAPGAVADRIKDSVRWIQLYKKAVRFDKERAAETGEELKPISAIKVPVIINKKKEAIRVSATEIELWADLHRLLGEKPFISVSNSKYASVAFKDKRAATTDIMVSAAYEALRELGAEIKEVESKNIEQTISFSGFGKKKNNDSEDAAM